MMGVLAATCFDRPVPIQASSLARLSTLLTSSVGRAFLETNQPISDVSASKLHSPCDEEAFSLASPSGTNETAPCSVHSLRRFHFSFEKQSVRRAFESHHLLA
jgi:hypothetical protein